MEQIDAVASAPQVIMGAAVDAEMKGRLSVTLIAARNTAPNTESPR